MQSTASAVAEAVRTRQPVPADGPRVATLVREAGGLDRNSDYTYLLLCSHFAETCAVAERGGAVVGFASGYRLPRDPTVLFVWQVAVSPTCRGRGVASQMVNALLDRRAAPRVRYLEATVTPSNTASQRLFRGVARRRDAPCRELPHFDADLFPAGDHEPEILFRIGPLPAPDARPTSPRRTDRTRDRGASMKVIERLESEVRTYCRSFPVVFATGQGAYLYDEDGREYIDFLGGAGALNYGHNNPVLKARVLEYLEGDGVVHGLDMTTAAKVEFLETFEELILRPRNLDYKVQFTGPTGTNAVEAALKLARKATGRAGVIAFTNGYHGLTMGALGVTGNQSYRRGLEAIMSNTSFLPFDGYMEGSWDSIALLEQKLTDGSSGLDLPAAVIVETVQGEGGVNVAGGEWLRRLDALCRDFGILSIVDDIQVGCGRTGRFFSFEEAGIVPDLVALSKSIGAYGLPMALLLIKPELDTWRPGEHTGTFRGNNLAFVAAAEALRRYWTDDSFTEETAEKSRILRDRLQAWQRRYPQLDGAVRGRGLIYGFECGDPATASALCRAAFQRGVIIETAGAQGQVLKFLPPLVIERETLEAGLDRLEDAIADVLGLPRLAARELVGAAR